MGIARATAGTATVRQLPENNIDPTATEHIFSLFSKYFLQLSGRVEVGIEFLKIALLAPYLLSGPQISVGTWEVTNHMGQSDLTRFIFFYFKFFIF